MVLLLLVLNTLSLSLVGQGSENVKQEDDRIKNNLSHKLSRKNFELLRYK